ncbi:MAG: hypothetical protein CMM58_09475 [Rhodospirillaceae bacterium]|nr:hypothetical protein [Rhodospirillaceae bacterium]|tara:strand:+ start:332 stop:700 length:369 start_codon:yes stop_codon:yes gene_type:complete
MAKRVNSDNFPWSIKGVSADARNMAKARASAAGITMGQWLTAVIRGEHDTLSSISKEQATISKKESTNNENMNEEIRTQELLVEKLNQTEARLLEAIRPLNSILKQLSLRIEVLENRSETDQ